MSLLDDRFKCIQKELKSSREPIVYIFGDFNSRKISCSSLTHVDTGLNISDSMGQLFTDMLDYFGAQQMVNFPTREKHTLDLIILSDNSSFENTYPPDKLSDHDMVSTTINCSLTRTHRPKRTCFLFSKGNLHL